MFFIETSTEEGWGGDIRRGGCWFVRAEREPRYSEMILGEQEKLESQQKPTRTLSEVGGARDRSHTEHAVDESVVSL